MNDDEIVSAVYPQLGYDAVAVGDQELINGIDFFKTNLNGRMNFISANLEFSDRSVKIEKYRIIQTNNGVRIGVTSVNFNTNFKYLMRTGTITEADISVGLAFDNLKQVISELRNKSDLIVVIAQLSEEGTIKLLDNVEGFDLVISGNNGEEFKYARRIENKIHVQNGRDGEKIGKVVYNFDPEGKPEFSSYELVKVLTKIYRRNAKIEEIIRGMEN
jgi:2',3'-cyclic-nucleotide 2'-phosphodiesterase (5'-nucleotidase family)